jgi:hypothetical protein
MACEGTDRRQLSRLRRFKKNGLFSCGDPIKPIGRESSQLYASVSKSQFTVSSYSLIRAVDAGLVPSLTYFVPKLSLKLYF